jgi:RNA polymerase sigma factor (sigma-70 family)
MPGTEQRVPAGTTNDTWRTWLMTGARRAPADRRRVRGANKGLKKMLLEGMSNGDDGPHAWKDFSGAMIRHAVDDAIRSLPQEDKHVLKLAYFGGYSNREIASQVGLTEGTVQRRLRRALAAISEQIQHGRALGRRVVNALLIGLCSRWLHDTGHQVVQVAAVACAAAIVVAQPALTSPLASPHSPSSTSGATGPMDPSMPAPAIPASIHPGTPPVAAPKVSPPTVKLPIDVPALPTLPLKVESPVQGLRA